MQGFLRFRSKTRMVMLQTGCPGVFQVMSKQRMRNSDSVK